MAKTKITVSINERYVAKLDRIAKIKNSNRSRMIEEAIEVWEKEYVEKALRHGYGVMAKEDSRAAEEYVKIAQELLHE